MTIEVDFNESFFEGIIAGGGDVCCWNSEAADIVDEECENNCNRHKDTKEAGGARHCVEYWQSIVDIPACSDRCLSV